jgi:PilZ domain
LAIRELRNSPRRRIFKTGVIEFGDAVPSSVACTVRSVSETGAGLILNSPLWFPDEFTLAIESDGVRRPCRAVWRKENRVGVVFTDVAS